MTRRLPHLRGRRTDGGWLSLELVGTSFFLFLAALMVTQVAAATYTIAQANGAARAAARAATLTGGAGADAAARGAVSESLRDGLVATGGSTGDGQRWSVTLRVPHVLPRLPEWSVTRSASMPATETVGG
ncbi:hypothetical protein [Angustibacter sp. Root456]|uniref:hypothetical protein n=1 Tax=Angustibacter sp. Root456 TaxID=1736539 RepID=UPI0006FF1B6B|nr:hypothetical protein [Angustibacter sp. Root456]KQX65965.1 hypothetical protein ASD06_06085 [Angustibacter sp. Root456]